MSDVPRISPSEAHRLMKDEAFTYVDVRTEEEFSAGHPESAINVPLMRSSAQGMEPNPDFVPDVVKRCAKDAPIIVGCKMGGRSARAAEALGLAGFTRVVDQLAGWDGTRGSFNEIVVPGWSRTPGLPTSTGT